MAESINRKKSIADVIKPDKNTIIPALIISFIFALMLPVGRAFREYNSLGILTSDREHVISFWLSCILFTAIFFVVINIVFKLFDFLRKKGIYADAESKANGRESFFIKYRFIMWLILFVCAMIIFIAIYPGILMGDTSSQISEAFGAEAVYAYRTMEYQYADSTLTSMHPVISTLFLKLCMFAGHSIFGTFNAGIAVYVALQTLLMTFAFSRSCFALAKACVKDKVILVYMIIICINPIIINYLSVLTKDTIFVAFLLLYATESYVFIKGFEKKRDTVLLAAAALGTVAFRGEGVYLMIIFNVVMILCFLLNKRSKKKEGRKKAFQTAGITGGVIILHFIWVLVAFPALHVTPGVRTHQIVIPMQQVARYVIAHEDELTDEEYKNINELIEIKDIKDGYDPGDADAVKMRSDINAKDEVIDAFMKTWKDIAAKDPKTAFIAWLNTKYEYFYFENTALKIYNTKGSLDNMNWLNERIKTGEGSLQLYYPERTASLRSLYEKALILPSKIPVLKLIALPAFYVFLFFVVLIYLFCKKSDAGKRLSVILLFIFFVVNLFSAPNGGYGRYLYPIIMLLPFIFLAGLADCKAKE